MVPAQPPDSETAEPDGYGRAAEAPRPGPLPAVEAEPAPELLAPLPVAAEDGRAPGSVSAPAGAVVAPRKRWSVRLRWFSGQLLVVVTGILVALALDAWWDARQDRVREQSYLRQLDADLAETLAGVAGYDRFLQPVDRAAALLVRAYHAPAPPPPDSLAAWLLLGSRFGVPRPVLGTAEALVATGDLRLIRTDSLRTEIVAYLESTRGLLESQDVLGGDWRQGFGQVRRRVDFTDIAVASRTPEAVDSLARADPYYEVPAGARQRPFPVDAAALLRDREVYEGLWTMNSSKRNLAQIRASMTERATRLRRLVRSAIAR